MRLSRLFINQPLIVGQSIVLSKESAHYVLKVLRFRVGTQLIVFNGKGGEYTAYLKSANKKQAQIYIESYQNIERESPLAITLVQAISRPEHFNYTLQKSVELGVTRIIPVLTERSPPFDKTKILKRQQHWQKIIINTCEQCGRNFVPQLDQLLPLATWLATSSLENVHYLVLAPEGRYNLTALIENNVDLLPVTVLIGAEGGLTAMELITAKQANYLDMRLGMRILRTETAAVAILSILQAWWGDLGR
ncbi:MAG: 16S rRNA (uracil(1498)-N(3))-methyltransferase [Thiomargarita sp.]|nr:16S rRNA (uracil(1498)-N(3))-methyltransferase [Thiomargarita sp.]